MKELLNRIFKIQVFKIFSINGLLVFGRLISSFVVSKVSAIYLGPSGYALLGNFKNVLQFVLGITSTGFESGIIRYTAENKNDKNQFNIIISSVISLCILVSIVFGVLLYLFADFLSLYVLRGVNYGFAFKYLAFFLPFASLNFLVVYIFNGLQNFKIYAILITISNVLNAILTFLLIYYLNLKGAILASFVVPFLTLASSLVFKEVRQIIAIFYINLKRISISFIKSISTYLLMATYSSLLISLAYLLIRNNIISKLNTENAGLWEALNKISTFYMVFFSSLFTLYLLPQLAVNKSIKGYKRIMTDYFKYLIPFTICAFLILQLFRKLLIKFFLTEEFEEVEQFFYLQLIADFIKIVAFSIAYQFHAKKMVMFYVISDAVLYLSFYFLSLYFINYFLLHGVFYAYLISAILYLVAVSIFVYFNNSNYLSNDA